MWEGGSGNQSALAYGSREGGPQAGPGEVWGLASGASRSVLACGEWCGGYARVPQEGNAGLRCASEVAEVGVGWVGRKRTSEEAGFPDFKIMSSSERLAMVFLTELLFTVLSVY